MEFKRVAKVTLCLTLICIILSFNLASAKVRITIWGLNDTVPGGDRALVQEFNRTHPDIELIAQVYVAGSAVGTAPETFQKLMTAIAAGTAPDIALLDRPAIAGWAARGALENLQPFVNQDKDFKWNQFYPACRKECIYENNIYAVPRDNDCRVLYYNKKLFKNAGLNPSRPPYTWTELVEYTKRLTTYDASGRFKTFGLFPICGNPAWLYIYALQNGGDLFSPDGKKATMDTKEWVEALKWVVDFYDQMGGAEKVAGFTNTFGTGAQDPFLAEVVAMYITGDWVLNNMARYKPTLSFGVAPIPVPDDRYNQVGRFKGQPRFITWSGGWSFVMPKGGKHPKETWEVMKWLVSTEGFSSWNKGEAEYNKSLGVKFYAPRLTSISSYDKKMTDSFLKDESVPSTFKEAKRRILQLMQYTFNRPSNPITLEAYAEHKYAIEDAIYHRKTPEEALKERNAKVQNLIDEFYRVH